MQSWVPSGTKEKDIRHHQCIGGNWVDWEETEESDQMEVSTFIYSLLELLYTFRVLELHRKSATRVLLQLSVCSASEELVWTISTDCRCSGDLVWCEPLKARMTQWDCRCSYSPSHSSPYFLDAFLATFLLMSHLSHGYILAKLFLMCQWMSSLSSDIELDMVVLVKECVSYFVYLSESSVCLLFKSLANPMNEPYSSCEITVWGCCRKCWGQHTSIYFIALVSV